jgi:hypothetical protein|tara:strand:+ start:524 stop:724 length:201 start_codon:yes stop_codon:yes gene_type:complete
VPLVVRVVVVDTVVLVVLAQVVRVMTEVVVRYGAIEAVEVEVVLLPQVHLVQRGLAVLVVLVQLLL